MMMILVKQGALKIELGTNVLICHCKCIPRYCNEKWLPGWFWRPKTLSAVKFVLFGTRIVYSTFG